MDTVDTDETDIKVDEVNESTGRVESLDLPQQQLAADESWLDQEDAQELEPEEPKQNVSRAHTRPPLRKDQWAPAPQQPPPPAPPTSAEETEAPTDSLSLMQLKRIVKDMPAKEPTPYAFTYTDSSNFEEELEELFGYSVEERRFLVQLPDAFQRIWQEYADAEADNAPQEEEQSVWWESDNQTRRSFVHRLGTGIDQDDNEKITYLQALLYIALGCWLDLGTETHREEAQSNTVTDKHDKTSEHQESEQSRLQMHIAEIHKNVRMITDVIRYDAVFQVLRHACTKAKQRHSSEDSLEGEQGKAALLENDVELWCCLLLTYLLVEQDWRQVLNSPDAAAAPESFSSNTDLLQFLSCTIADMRWEESGASPPVKLLSLYWKTMLLTFGGIERVNAIKKTLDQDNTPKSDEVKPYITASPLDYHFFRQEITSKYPAIDPPQPLFPFEPENTSFIPPLQEHAPRPSNSNGSSFPGPASVNGTAASIFHQPVHISTPAPSPPPSPAGPGGKVVKKQNYQTNQMFPFLYPPLEPSSNDIGGKGSTEIQDALVGRKWAGSDIPASILEAADLFAKRMRATRAMKQLWEERVRFMKFERGYDTHEFRLEVDEEDDQVGEEAPDASDTSMDILDERSKQSLRHVEDFYAAELPRLQSNIIVFLKVLLQTVTTLVTQPNMPSGLQTGFQSPENGSQNHVSVNGETNETEHKQMPTVLQNLDVVRSQEIMCKAVSGIILLLMKWFRLSHVLKFEFLSQLLLDSNYVQLILKLFTHQELERVVNFKCERPGLNFFNLCQSQAQGIDILALDGDEIHDPDEAVPPPIPPRRQAANSDSADDVPPSATRSRPPDASTSEDTGPAPIIDYSWRNFFTAINHLRILQKLVKNKAHRQLMMVQYKYSNILRKSLKVFEPSIRLYTLKIIKGQVPYCHRKWRQSNMRIITLIYLYCKPELRDDWLAGLALEEDMSEALPLEQALRSLTYWHNLKRYPEAMGQDREKARGLLEEEQDFFTRELDAMEAGMEKAAAAAAAATEEAKEEGDGGDDPLAVGLPPGIPMQMDAW